MADALVEGAQGVMQSELGKTDVTRLDERIRAALAGESDWVLIGGPPCQAYSLAGRGRRARDEAFEQDERHFLYREYLRIIRRHAPAVFVMENVKGMLSSKHGGSPMFARILRDLRKPSSSLHYEVRSLVKPGTDGELDPSDYVIESERYGVPQTRHRVILLGVRSDLAHRPSRILTPVERPVTVTEMIGSMPRLRSRLSRETDSHAAWLAALGIAVQSVDTWAPDGKAALVRTMRAAVRAAADIEHIGGPYVSHTKSCASMPAGMRRWMESPGLEGVIQHETRSHMASDLARYLFASSFAAEFGSTPRLQSLPESLLPDHRSSRPADGGKPPYSDRFRVQIGSEPSSTVVSHIAKDGHYYIHPDPAQCRSLTVREAARLQTFPEDYFFEGNRTQQYVQVGNAVPPLLASRIASVVLGLIRPVASSAGASGFRSSKEESVA
ncbi:DNA cytosine methyltransferase [Piscinibacterium candidicorallinum]|uniref:DNA (cytosine-5-)-methyltransferase n=1 Tax=Piscinibacterium candidicorallinum TaxID=1793872 RepID=A0ABV7H6Q6_9BURK